MACPVIARLAEECVECPASTIGPYLGWPADGLGRQVEVAHIADAALFLLSDLASYITAQVLVVDGGVSAAFPP